MTIERHLECVVMWLRDTLTSKEGKKILASKQNAFGEDTFDFEENKDSFLDLSSTNQPLKTILEGICDKKFLEENNLFYTKEEIEKDNDLAGCLDTDKLNDYYQKYERKYLEDYDVLVFSERIMEYDDSDSTDLYYIVDYGHRKIYLLRYEQLDCGDDSWLDLEDEVAEF